MFGEDISGASPGVLFSLVFPALILYGAYKERAGRREERAVEVEDPAEAGPQRGELRFVIWTCWTGFAVIALGLAVYVFDAFGVGNNVSELPPGVNLPYAEEQIW